MSDRLYLTVDCSTTASKAVLFGDDGVSVATARRPLELLRPRPGFHEQDALQWWQATHDAIAEVVAGLDRPERIVALCVTHQRESFVCLDDSGRPMRPAVLWVDSRATQEIAEYGSAQVARTSGKPPDTTPALYKLAWLRRNEPATLETAARVGDVHAYLSLQLTGHWATSVGSADALGLFDLDQLTWSPALLEVAGVRVEQLPALVASGEVIGQLTEEVTRSLGLPGPIPLVAGTGDGQAAGLGADSGQPGAAYLNLGTSMVAGITAARFVTDPAFRTLAAPVTGEVVLETVLNSAGYLVEWFAREIGDPAAADLAATHIAPGCDGLLTLPYWNAAQSPHWDALARGATVGWHGGHTSAHLYRSMLEGVAFELRLHLDGLERATGREITSLHSVGGGSTSLLWRQIVADVTGRTVRTSAEPQASAKGAAVIAHAWATGRGNEGITAAATEFAGALTDVEPDPDTRPRYEQPYAAYLLLYAALAPVFAALPSGG